nr:hypothetical protein [Marinobacter maroccanus]
MCQAERPFLITDHRRPLYGLRYKKKKTPALASRFLGVLLIGGHYSIFDFALPLIACRLDKPGYMYRPNNNPVIDRMIERGRRRHFGIRPFTKRQIRPMLSFLKEGGRSGSPVTRISARSPRCLCPFSA